MAVKTIAEMLVRIGADITKFEKEMANVQKALKNTGDKFKNVGAEMTKKITVPIAAVGVAAFAAANEYDKATATIRTGTGATGDALKELQQSFENVFKQVPQDAATVSAALADLNTRTGLVGEPLEKLTKQVLNLSRVSGVDAPALIASATRAFGDWGVSMEDSADVMDHLWKVSQTTGIGIDQLMNKVVQFGAPMRQMGLSFEEVTALFGKWEKEGVNAELVAGSLRIALGKLAKDGLEPAEAFPKIVDQIKNMKKEGDATALAMELFGSRAGPDMAAAIREGRFEITDLMAVIEGSGETIESAGKDALTFGERMSIIKNQATAAIEPIGRVFMDFAESVLPKVTAAVEKVSSFFENMSPGVRNVVIVVGLLAAALGPLIMFVGMVISGIGALIPVFAFLVSPVGLVIAAIVSLIGILVYLYARFEWMRTATAAIWEGIKIIIMSVVNAIMGIFTGFFQFVTGIWDVLAGLLTGDWSRLWEGIKNTLVGASKVLYGIMTLSVVGRITKLFTAFLKSGKKWGSGLINGFITGIKNRIGAVVDTVKGVMNRVKGFLGFNSPSKKGEGRYIEHWGGNMVGGFLDGVKAAGPQVAKTMAGLTAGMGAGVNINANNLTEIEANNRVKHEFSPVTVNITGDNGQLNNATIARAIEQRIAETIARDNRRLPNRASLGGAR